MMKRKPDLEPFESVEDQRFDVIFNVFIYMYCYYNITDLVNQT